MNVKLLCDPPNAFELWLNTEIKPKFLTELTFKMIERWDRHGIFAVVDAVIVGALVWVESSSQYIDIRFISVVDSYKNKGIATAMFKQLQTIIGTEKKIYPGQYEPEGLLYFKKMVDQHNSF